MNALLLAAAMAGLGPDGTPAPIVYAIEVPASIESVWARWTTDEGLTTFFARAVNVDLRVGGDYEIYFAPDNPPGTRGAEGIHLMALEPPRRLAFEWDAPPAWPEQRRQHTMVEVRLTSIDTGTRVELRHAGWGDGPKWGEVRDYFDAAWQKILSRLAYSFEVGPIDWDNPPAELITTGSSSKPSPQK